MPVKHNSGTRQQQPTLKLSTAITRVGRTIAGGNGINPPVVRATTIAFNSHEELVAAKVLRERGGRVLDYGRNGTPTTYGLEDAMTTLEGGHGCRLFGSGLAAIAACFGAFCFPGQTALLMRCCYEPVQRLARDYLQKQGINVRFYSPDLHDLNDVLDEHVSFVWAEVPNSPTFAMCDISALCARVKQVSRAVVAVDNTWAAGIAYHPMASGADLSVISGSKYLCGHSDLSLGIVVSNERAWSALRNYAEMFGHCITPDAAYDAQKALRTLCVRMAAHQHHALRVIEAIRRHPKVAHIHYPALPESPGFHLWRRDFTGATGLICVEFRGIPAVEAERVVNSLLLFSIGYSWGGYESLALLVRNPNCREEQEENACPYFLRLHIGLEDPDDLSTDLLQALDG